ncbi:LOW QUALITY PROTEIN: reverse transcriptase, partial [Phytophthora palmivora]
MVDEVLPNCHNSVEGGHQGIVRTYHRVKSDYYWIGLYADVVRHVQPCEDCCTSKSKPHLRGYSPGNIVTDRRFHIVSMGFVIPLPRTRRGNTALLLFQDHSNGAMAETGALEAAKVFEESVFRRFGAPSLVRHDRDPRFISEMFQKFSEMMQSRSRATMCYRPQANGQQERREDGIRNKQLEGLYSAGDSILPGTWLGCSINDKGYDGSGTAKIARLIWPLQPSGAEKQTDKEELPEYQLKEKAHRAKEHNESLSRVEQRVTPQARSNSETAESGGASAESFKATAESMGTPAESTKSLFKEGDQ